MFTNLLRSDIAPDPRTRCRACGSTAYRKVIARDAQGRLTASGLPGRSTTFLGALPTAAAAGRGQFAI